MKKPLPEGYAKFLIFMAEVKNLDSEDQTLGNEVNGIKVVMRVQDARRLSKRMAKGDRHVAFDMIKEDVR